MGREECGRVVSAGPHLAISEAEPLARVTTERLLARERGCRASYDRQTGVGWSKTGHCLENVRLLESQGASCTIVVDHETPRCVSLSTMLFPMGPRCLFSGKRALDGPVRLTRTAWGHECTVFFCAVQTALEKCRLVPSRGNERTGGGCQT